MPDGPFRNANIGAFPADFHPCREFPFASGKPWDPNKAFLRELHRQNGLTILSETVALDDSIGQCDGLRTCDRGRIQRYVDNVRAVDIELGGEAVKFFYHTELLLGGINTPWWPKVN